MSDLYNLGESFDPERLIAVKDWVNVFRTTIKSRRKNIEDDAKQIVDFYGDLQGALERGELTAWVKGPRGRIEISPEFFLGEDAWQAYVRPSMELPTAAGVMVGAPGIKDREFMQFMLARPGRLRADPVLDIMVDRLAAEKEVETIPRSELSQLMQLIIELIKDLHPVKTRTLIKVLDYEVAARWVRYSLPPQSARLRRAASQVVRPTEHARGGNIKRKRTTRMKDAPSKTRRKRISVPARERQGRKSL